MKTKFGIGVAAILLGMSGVVFGAQPKYKSIFFSDEAEKYLEKWESDKSWSDAIVEADALYKARKYSEAAARYEKAISQGYRQPQGMFNFAHCLDQTGQKEKALAQYLKAAEQLEARGLKNSTLFESYYRAGVLCGENKEYAQSLLYLDKARRIESNNTDLLFSLAVVNENQGKIDAAEKYYQAALGLDPKFEEARKNLERLQEKRNLPVDLTEILKRQHLPGKIPLEIVRLDQLGDKALNEKIGQLEARRMLEKGKALGQIHYELGLYYATAREYSKALENIEKARQLKYKPISPFVLGYIYSKMKQTEKALNEYRSFVRQEPKDPVGHYNLAVMYDNHTKQYRKAIHHYRRYIQLAKQGARDADDVGRRIWLLSNARNP